MTAEAQWLELGRIGGPYGVKGWVHVQPFTQHPERLLAAKSWRLSGGDTRGEPRAYRLAEGRAHGRGLVARLEGVTTREAAEALRGLVIEVPRSELPAAGPREHFCADLVGCEVRNVEGALLGRVSHFVEAPASDVMVVRGAREHWIPATPRHLLKVEPEGFIRVDWPADF
jgi:16S rRNA processing protein RimM